MNIEAKELMKEADYQLNKAIVSGAVEEWRLYKHMRNRFFRFIEGAKSIYYAKILSRSRDIWKTAKSIMKQDSAIIPDKIQCEGKLERSPMKIADSFCLFFIQKIRKIKKKIPKTNLNPMRFMEMLIPRVEKELVFWEITVRDAMGSSMEPRVVTHADLTQ